MPYDPESRVFIFPEQGPEVVCATMMNWYIWSRTTIAANESRTPWIAVEKSKASQKLSDSALGSVYENFTCYPILLGRFPGRPRAVVDLLVLHGVAALLVAISWQWAQNISVFREPRATANKYRRRITAMYKILPGFGRNRFGDEDDD